jgi:hypothetical protein
VQERHADLLSMRGLCRSDLKMISDPVTHACGTACSMRGRTRKFPRRPKAHGNFGWTTKQPGLLLEVVHFGHHERLPE